MQSSCGHLDQLALTEPTPHVCEQCVALGDRCEHPRMCLICGQVGCRDASKNKRATKHFHGSGHPLIRSTEPGESRVFCYVDNVDPDDVL